LGDKKEFVGILSCTYAKIYPPYPPGGRKMSAGVMWGKIMRRWDGETMEKNMKEKGKKRRDEE
jgi:hypothetical protein